MNYFRNIALLLFLVLLPFCQGGPRNEGESKYADTDLDLSVNLSDFTSKMSETDTLIILTNLTMEQWVRLDKITLTHQNNKLNLQITVSEDTTFERKYQMRTNNLENIQIENRGNRFETYFVDRIERTKLKRNSQWMYKIIYDSDTLTFYTTGLGDKGGEVPKYFDFVGSYYIGEEEFNPL